MKFRAHDTFFIRKGWLSKGMKSVLANPNIFMGLDADGAKINPMDALGIGANMVKSLRYWLQAVGLTEERLEDGRKKQFLTPLGAIIHKSDPYIEETGTLCLLHHRLATNEEQATAWYYFFNEFAVRSFSRDDFVTAIASYAAMGEEVGASHSAISTRSLVDDFDCLIKTYVSRDKKTTARTSPENNIDSPFGELGLIDIEGSKSHISTYRKRSINKTLLPPIIALALITDWSNGKQEVLIGDLLNGRMSVGKIFNLDTVSLSTLLFDLESSGHLKVIRTAGLDVVRMNNSMTFEQCISHYYKSIS